MSYPLVYHVLEALLFASGQPVPEEQLLEVIDQVEVESESAEIEEYINWYNSRDGGLEIIRVAGGLQLVTRPIHADAVRRLKTTRQKKRFSKAALEVLAITAYRQPVTAPEIENIRGVDSSGVLKNLLEKNMITILGKKHGPGNPVLYGTTNHFLVVFGLNDLESLPPVEDFQQHIKSQNKTGFLPFAKQDTKNEAMQQPSQGSYQSAIQETKEDIDLEEKEDNDQ